jgi:hypothetical protein
MKSPYSSAAKAPLGCAIAALLCLLNVPAPLLAQEGAAESTAESDIEAARGASRGESGTARGDERGSGGSSPDRPSDRAADEVDRIRTRALPGAQPGFSPPERVQGRSGVVTELPDAIGGEGGAAVPGAARDRREQERLPRYSGENKRADELRFRRERAERARLLSKTDFATRERAVAFANGGLRRGDALDSELKRGVGGFSGAERVELNESLRQLAETRSEFSRALARARAADRRRWRGSRDAMVRSYRAFEEAQARARDAALQAGWRLEEAQEREEGGPAVP